MEERHSRPGLKAEPEEPALRGESGLQMETLVSNLKTGVAVLDPEGRIRFANPFMALLLDCPGEELAGQDLASFLPEEARRKTMEALEAQAKGRPGRCEARFIGSSGYPRDVELAASALANGGGPRSGLRLVSAIDITRRKEVEEDLEEQVHTQNTLLETLPNPVFYQDTTGAYSGCNPAFLDLLGLTREEVLGRRPTDLDPSDLGVKYEARDGELLDSPGTQVYESKVRQETGAMRDVLVKKATLRSRHGEPLGLIGMMTDITDRKRGEEALRRSEQELRAIVENATLGIFRSDLDGEFIWANQALADILGLDGPKDVETRSLLGDIYAKPSAWDELVERGSRGEPIVGAEAEWKRGDGSPVRVRLSGRMVQNVAGRPDGFEIIVEDLSERDELEAQIRLANKLEAVGQLAAGIAHEINTPMQYIGDNVQFLNEATEDVFELLKVYEKVWGLLSKYSDLVAHGQEVADAEEAADLEYLKENVPDSFRRLEEGIGRVSGIVRAMKDFSHPDRMEMAPGDLNQALESTLAVARNEYKYVADVETEFGDIPEVVCCSGELNQAFLNLVVNAGHAIAEIVEEGEDERGTITVRTEMDGADHVLVTIADSGPGIPEDVQHRIFDPFFTTKEVGKGSGQGLAIVHSVVVDRHRGTLDFVSKPGEGTRFTIRLPINGPGHKLNEEVVV